MNPLETAFEIVEIIEKANQIDIAPKDIEVIRKILESKLNQIKKDLLAIADAGEYEDMRREICRYWVGNIS